MRQHELRIFWLLLGEKERKKRKKRETGFSHLQGNKRHVILDTIINVTKVLFLINVRDMFLMLLLFYILLMN